MSDNFEYKESVARSLARLIYIKMNKRCYDAGDLSTIALSWQNIYENGELDVQLIASSLVTDMMPVYSKNIFEKARNKKANKQ